MHKPPAEGSFCVKYGRAHKTATIKDCSQNMIYIEEEDTMTYLFR
jgi:hypothetical protein